MALRGRYEVTVMTAGNKAELIAAMFGQGLTDREIGARLSLHPGSVRRWRYRLGLKRPPNPGPHWTDADDREVTRLLRSGFSDAQIGDKLGRSAPTSIKSRRRNMRLLRIEERPWSADDNERMRELWESGASTREIAAELSRSPGAITQKRRQLGLPPRA